MLIQFSVENFKSFNSRQDLSMISSNKIREKDDHCVELKNVKILKNAAIYGANASGKTNAIKVLQFMKVVLLYGLPVNSSDLYCRNYKENKDKESLFEVRFSINDKFYAFGFNALLDKREITNEWLYELLQNGSAKSLYVKEGNKISLGKQLRGDELNRFNIYTDDYINSNHKSDLFISEMNRNKDIKEESPLAFFKDAYRYLINNIVVIMPNTTINNTNLYSNKETLSRISELMKSFDTGINTIETKNITLDELANSVPREVFNGFTDYIEIEIKKNPNRIIQATLRSDNSYYCIETDGKKYNIHTILFNHGIEKSLFNYYDESDGTKRLLDLIELITQNKEDVVYVVDELERSLHPKLTERLLELFNNAHKDNKVQLIFSTHENEIMDQSIFRRDEIWFAEREKDNSTKLYSLDRFKERYDKKIGKAYLDGRYGALPVFKDFDFKEES